MNKKGNVFFALSIAILIWVFGILFIPFITDNISYARNDLNCSLDTISGGTMMTCLIIGIVNPYFIWFIISAAMGYLIGGSK